MNTFFVSCGESKEKCFEMYDITSTSKLADHAKISSTPCTKISSTPCGCCWFWCWWSFDSTAPRRRRREPPSPRRGFESGNQPRLSRGSVFWRKQHTLYTGFHAKERYCQMFSSSLRWRLAGFQFAFWYTWVQPAHRPQQPAAALLRANFLRFYFFMI